MLLALTGEQGAAQDPAPAIPGLSLFGVPGHVTMPSAFALPDGNFAVSVSQQGSAIRRGNLVFQITPWLTGSFRYGYLEDFNIHEGGISLYDRSFDLIWQIAREDHGSWRPALAIGLQDFGGTGVYGAEYLVASKHFGPHLAVSAGIGWGRFGSYGSFRNPLSVISGRFDDRPKYSGIDETGKIAFDRFFRGEAALFFGADWQAAERLRLSVEYSSDAMRDEVRIIGFDHRSPVNIGIGYRLQNGAELGLSYLHGSTLALSYSLVFDPRRPAIPSGAEPGPPPVMPGAQAAAASWGKQAGKDHSGDHAALERALNAQGIRLEAVVIEGDMARVSVTDPTWPATAQGWGRAMRVLSAQFPAEITRFRLQSRVMGMALREITLTRADLEELEYAPDGAWQIWARADSRDALASGRPDPRLAPGASASWRLRPYLEPSYFDPDNPLRFDLGAELTGEWSPVAGLYFSGSLRQKLAGNLDEAGRSPNSVLPHVRSDASRYFLDAGPRLPWLTAEYFTRPGENLYGRVSAGLLEQMFGGVSAELLWAPPDRRLALGVEINHVKKRDFDGIGFLDYAVTTGHVSAYYDLGDSYFTQIDAGRYLAGDWGATASFGRRFGNGFEVSAFFTLTDAGFDDFGEGAFDKGVTISVPLALVTGQPSRERGGVTLRPILRDGGARLQLRNRLYDLTRDDREAAQGKRWARFWR